MKKAPVLALLLLFGLLFYGCGSRHGESSSNGGTTPGGGSPSGPGTFTLYMVDADSLNKVARYTVPGTIQTPTDVRAVIRSFATTTVTQIVCDIDVFGDPIPGTCVNVDVPTFTEVYRDIQDMPYSGPTATIGVPALSGVQIEIITSVTTTPPLNHSIVKYGKVSGLNITSGGGATIIMNTVNSVLNMTVQNDTISNQQFDVTLNDVLPFSPSYSMTMKFGTNTPVKVFSTGNMVTFTAPVSFSTGSITLQGTFTLDSSLRKLGEPEAQWTRIYPNTAYGEFVYSNLDPLFVITVPTI